MSLRLVSRVGWLIPLYLCSGCSPKITTFRVVDDQNRPVAGLQVEVTRPGEGHRLSKPVSIDGESTGVGTTDSDGGITIATHGDELVQFRQEGVRTVKVRIEGTTAVYVEDAAGVSCHEVDRQVEFSFDSRATRTGIQAS